MLKKLIAILIFIHLTTIYFKRKKQQLLYYNFFNVECNQKSAGNKLPALSVSFHPLLITIN